MESLCYTLLELWLGKQWWSATETKNIEKPQQAAPPPSKDHQNEHASGKLNRKRLRKSSSCSSKVTAQKKKVSNRHSYAQINLAPKSKGDTVHATAQCNHLKSLKLRSQAWNNLVVQGKHLYLSGEIKFRAHHCSPLPIIAAGQVPNFLITWRNYCKGLDAKTFPDYEYLADLIHCAPVKLDKAAKGVDVKPHQPGLQDLAARREE